MEDPRFQKKLLFKIVLFKNKFIKFTFPFPCVAVFLLLFFFVVDKLFAKRFLMKGRLDLFVVRPSSEDEGRGPVAQITNAGLFCICIESWFATQKEQIHCGFLF